MNKKFMNQPLSRPLTPREKRIRSKWALAFVIITLIAICLVVKNSNMQDDLEKQRGINVLLQTQTVKMKDREDSLRSKLFVCNVQLQRWEGHLKFLKRENQNLLKDLD